MPLYLFIETGCLLIGVLVGKTLFKNRLSKFIFLYTIISVLTDIAGYVISRGYGMQNGILFNIYDLFKYISLFLYFRFYLQTVSQKMFYAIAITYIFALSIDIILLPDIHDLMVFSTLAGDLGLVICSLIFFKKLLQEPAYESILTVPVFWIVVGILLYFLGVLPYHLSWEFMVFKEVDSEGKLYRALLIMLIALHYISFSISFLLWKFQKTT